MHFYRFATNVTIDCTYPFADELQSAVESDTAPSDLQDTSQKAVTDAVALVVGSSRRGLVGLCTAVAKILKTKLESVLVL